MNREVFVAARGAVTGFGLGVAALLDGVFEGRCAIRPLRRLADAGLPTKVAAELPPGLLDDVAPGELPLRMACLAAEEALAELDEDERDGLALVVATARGGPDLAERLAAAVDAGGFCAAVPASATAHAAQRLRDGHAARALVIGVDALSAAAANGPALDPHPCRPFARDRAGTSLGEGAAALLLTADASESGGVALAGWGDAAASALAAAGLTSAEVDLVHLHGEGTRAGDAEEAARLVAAFGGRTPPAFGTKGQTGHTSGAAEVLETIVLIEALERGVAPPNLGLERSDVEGDLTLLRTPRTLARSRVGLKVGEGAALVLRRSEGD